MTKPQWLSKTLTFQALGGKLPRVRTPALGERELAVLDVLWRDGGKTAQQVLEHMPNADVTLNTVQSTLERLYRKKLLSRNKQARAYYYSAKVARAELISSLLRDISSDVAGGDLLPMISGFVRYLADDDPEALDQTLAQLGLSRRESDDD